VSITIVTVIITIAVFLVIIAAILMIGVVALQKPKGNQSVKSAYPCVCAPSK